MELFAKIVSGFRPLTVFTKTSILNVWQGSKYTSVINNAKFDKKVSVRRNLSLIHMPLFLVTSGCMVALVCKSNLFLCSDQRI